MKTHLKLLPLALVVASCTAGSDYAPPAFPLLSGWLGADNARTIAASDKQAITDWWKSVKDPTLETLINEASTHNHDIRIALASLDEARALRRVEAGQFYPSLGANASAARNGGDSSANHFDATLDATWEPDIFGGTRRAVEAADARADAREAEYQDVMLSVLAEVARNYYELRGVQRRIAVTRNNIDVLKEVEAVAQNRFEYGATSEFDVTQAKGEREATEATLPNLEAEMMATIYRLSVLTGKSPDHYVTTLKASAPLPMPPDMIPVGLPSDLLRRRPDIRKAERELAAATADIGVATADMFPRFPLTGSVGSTALRFSEFFASGGFTYFIAQAIAVPLFEGGRLRAEVDAANARQQQAVAAYEKAVVTALEDVESSLVRYGKEWETLTSLRAALATRKEAASIARLRYESGSEGFLLVLDAERSLIAIQDAIVQSETRILTRLTQLYKALGGGWEAFPTTEKAAAGI